jgi:hypothetical protein
MSPETQAHYRNEAYWSLIGMSIPSALLIAFLPFFPFGTNCNEMACLSSLFMIMIAQFVLIISVSLIIIFIHTLKSHRDNRRPIPLVLRMIIPFGIHFFGACSIYCFPFFILIIAAIVFGVIAVYKASME